MAVLGVELHALVEEDVCNRGPRYTSKRSDSNNSRSVNSHAHWGARMPTVGFCGGIDLSPESKETIQTRYEKTRRTARRRMVLIAFQSASL